MVAIVIASSRRGDPQRPYELWADAILARDSAALYAPGVEVVHAWQGPCPPPETVPNERLRSVRQPDHCGTYGEAFGWAVEQTDADELILMNDDAVLLPGTVRDLLADAALIRESHPELELGFLACRSNFVAGPQNVRAPNDSPLRPNCNRYESEDRILAAERISPIVAYLPRAALDAIGGFPPLNWFSDDLMCWDLMRRGYRNFISRSYVHHVGQRTTTGSGTSEAELLQEAQDWIREHRADFWDAIAPGRQSPVTG